MRRLAVVGIFVLVASAFFPGTTAAHTTTRVGWARPLENRYVGPSCVGEAGVWHQELGDSGVNRLRANFQVRGEYDTTGIPLLQYSETGWMYSRPFPSDATSYWVTWWPKVHYLSAGRYSLWAVFIGERPSFWQTDRKLTGPMGLLLCNAGPGTL